MPIFNLPLRKVDPADGEKAIKQLEQYIRYMQDQLEYTLMNLDSRNIVEISTDQTNITSSDGSVNITGDSIDLLGKQGERFRVGLDSKTNVFNFELKERGGSSVLYLDSTGNLVITKRATLSIDCGDW